MNKISRILGSTVLATGLVLGGSGAALAHDDHRDNKGSSYDRNNNRDRHDDKRNHDSRNHHDNDYKYLYRCWNRHGDRWYEWSYKYDERRNCVVILKIRKY